jgi:SAM-dependent methyltransferase
LLTDLGKLRYHFGVKNNGNKSVDLYDKVYQKIADGRLRYYMLPSENLVRILKTEDIQPTPENGLALDFGCGEGRHSALLAEFGFDVVATDVSEGAVRATKGRQPAGEKTGKIKSVVLLDPNNIRLPLEDSSTALIAAWEVLHWVGSKERFVQTLREFRRILKKDCYFVFSMPTESHFHRVESLEIGESQFLCKAEAREDCILYSPNLYTLKSILKAEGFELRRITANTWGVGYEPGKPTVDRPFAMYGFACVPEGSTPAAPKPFVWPAT